MLLVQSVKPFLALLHIPLIIIGHIFSYLLQKRPPQPLDFFGA